MKLHSSAYINSRKNFEDKVASVRPSLLFFCSSRIFNKHDAEDIVQEVTQILVEKKSEFDESKSFFSWAFRILHFQIKKYFTNLKRSNLVFGTFDNNEAREPCFTPRLNKFQKIRLLAINKSIKKLSPSLKLVAELRFNENFSINEISKKVNRSTGAVTATISRAKDFIRKNIHEEYLEAEMELEYS